MRVHYPLLGGPVTVVTAITTQVVTWTPATPADLSLWLKAPDLSAFEDAAKTDLCEDADGVYTWAAASPTIYDAVQATAGSRPPYAAASGGRPAVTDTGTDRSLTVADAVSLRRSTTGYAIPGFTVFGRFRVTNAVSVVAGKHSEWWIRTSPGTGQMLFGDPFFGPDVASAGNVCNGAWHYFVGRVAQAGNWEIAVDAETPVTAAAVGGGPTSNPLTLFTSIYGGTIHGGLNEFGLYPRCLTDGERDALRAYLAAG